MNPPSENYPAVPSEQPNGLRSPRQPIERALIGATFKVISWTSPGSYELLTRHAGSSDASDVRIRRQVSQDFMSPEGDLTQKAERSLQRSRARDLPDYWWLWGSDPAVQEASIGFLARLAPTPYYVESPRQEVLSVYDDVPLLRAAEQIRDNLPRGNIEKVKASLKSFLITEAVGALSMTGTGLSAYAASGNLELSAMAGGAGMAFGAYSHLKYAKNRQHNERAWLHGNIHGLNIILSRTSTTISASDKLLLPAQRSEASDALKEVGLFTEDGIVKMIHSALQGDHRTEIWPHIKIALGDLRHNSSQQSDAHEQLARQLKRRTLGITDQHGKPNPLDRVEELRDTQDKIWLDLAETIGNITWHSELVNMQNSLYADWQQAIEQINSTDGSYVSSEFDGADALSKEFSHFFSRLGTGSHRTNTRQAHDWITQLARVYDSNSSSYAAYQAFYAQFGADLGARTPQEFQDSYPLIDDGR